MDAVNLHRDSELTANQLVALAAAIKAWGKELGFGEIGVALTIRAHRFSATAREKIEAAGGKAEQLGAAE